MAHIPADIDQSVDAALVEMPDAQETNVTDEDIDAAFDEIDLDKQELAEKVERARVNETAGSFVALALDALRSGDNKSLSNLKYSYLADIKKNLPEVDEVTAMSTLTSEFDKIRGAFGGSEDKPGYDPAFAAEIDAFKRSLTTANNIESQAGKDFLDKLESGEISSIAEALASMPKGAVAEGMTKEQIEKNNNEGNLLITAIQKKFPESTAKVEVGTPTEFDFSGDESDDAFDNITMPEDNAS